MESIWHIDSKIMQHSDGDRSKISQSRGSDSDVDPQKTISQKNSQGKISVPKSNKKRTDKNPLSYTKERVEIEYTFNDRYMQPNNASISYQKTLSFGRPGNDKTYDIFVVGKDKGKGLDHTWIYRIDEKEVGRLEVPNSVKPGQGIKDPKHIFWKTLMKDLGIGYGQYEMIIKHAKERLK